MILRRKEPPHLRITVPNHREIAKGTLRAKPKKATSKNYVELTRKGLGNYKVFCLKDSRTKELMSGQWRMFLTHLGLFRSQNKHDNTDKIRM